MPFSDKRLLLASIHDVGPGSERQVDQLAGLLTDTLRSSSFAMLVVPDHWGRHPIRSGTPFASRLRAWSDSGIEMFVHGWYHKDGLVHQGLSGLKARYMTASEGEFLGLSSEEAARRMENGRALVEDIIGRKSAGFIAPAWLYGSGAMEALRDSSFELAEDHMKVWVPRTGKVVARGPVITWASRSPMRTASSLAFAALARQALHSLRTVRVAVHPGDVTRDSILTSIEKTLRCFIKSRDAGRYRSLVS
ncbi:polysaccharide deacetylase family protein [Sphingomonas psychrotolerans]|uniref:Polysaccharide deacetylase family protein n=1 Tax=Sphingomonas psychrotolerans TaxID=1327635 RepID=A0ABU3N6U5_9SPHN|nr:polysaccharide deacetylase family protein [Sphingomonas psychrotolerans]MDT8760222.1 polysaccharide deacetylase family protein [Sphingomonas psychrotolerans]